MRKYILMFSALIYMGISTYQLYYAYAPKVGPIGNGLTDKMVIIIWTQFIIFMIGGLSFSTLSIFMFIKDRKKKMEQ
ncbi:hypothetical protein [Neobacillus sp. D3-1R]|uniref:hypothetical protein n=1 Tax=Neobacillus sp. D3-1R TaxID=3445778 RepID=UPI003FA0DC35